MVTFPAEPPTKAVGPCGQSGRPHPGRSRVAFHSLSSGPGGGHVPIGAGPVGEPDGDAHTEPDGDGGTTGPDGDGLPYAEAWVGSRWPYPPTAYAVTGTSIAATSTIPVITCTRWRCWAAAWIAATPGGLTCAAVCAR